MIKHADWQTLFSTDASSFTADATGETMANRDRLKLHHLTDTHRIQAFPVK